MTDPSDRWDEQSAEAHTTHSMHEEGPLQSASNDEQRAREFFEQMNWFGLSPDPERLSAREFMRWIA